MMKQKFTILWIEDKTRIITRNEREVRDYLDEKYKEFELNMISDSTGDNVAELLDSADVDLVVTDNNLSKEDEGLEVLDKVRKKKRLTDVLLYSATEIDDEILEKARDKGFVEIKIGKSDVTDSVKKLIDKNMARYEDIIFLRGLVISRSIDLELEINSFFATYFGIADSKINDFHNFLLENTYIHMGGKVGTIECVAIKHKSKEFESLSKEIRVLSNIRNKLAHCKSHPTKDKTLISMGEDEEYNKVRIIGILKKLNQTSEKFNEISKKICSK